MRFTHALRRRGAIGIATAAIALVATSVSVAALSGTIVADGSSTVGPYTQAAAELFRKKNPNVNIQIGISGTGGGFTRFCKNEIDLSDASRPIKQSEAKICKDAGIPWYAFTVANDGITVAVNKENTWAKCLTVAQLKKIWNTGSKVNNWKDVDPSFPDVPLKLFGPGTDSGTFDFFTEVINGKSKASRSDYQASENDNVLVQGVEGEKGGMGYFGYSYYAENKSRLNAVSIDAGKGKGCVAPSAKAVQTASYKPLGRPLFIYAKAASFKRANVRGFLSFMYANERAIAKRSKLISLTDAQLKHARTIYKRALKASK